MRKIQTHDNRPAYNNKKSRKINSKRIVLWFLTIVSVIGLIVVLNYDNIQSFIARQNQASVIHTRGKQKHKPNFNYKKVKPVSAKSLADAYRKRANYKAIGQVAVPRFDINLNIYKGVGNTELNLGAGTMKRDQRMGHGNYCLAGHNMDDNKTFFSPLYSAKAKGTPPLVGTRVMLMNYKTVYYYKIKKAVFIKATDTFLLRNYGYTKVSLFTCDYTGAGRLIVVGKYQRKQRLVNAPKSVQQAFKKN